MALQEEMNGAQRVPVYFKATIQLWETHPNHTRPPMHLSASSIGGPSDAVRPVLPLRKGPATAADHEGYVVHGMEVTVTSRCGDFFCVRGWVRNTAQEWRHHEGWVKCFYIGALLVTRWDRGVPLPVVDPDHWVLTPFKKNHLLTWLVHHSDIKVYYNINRLEDIEDDDAREKLQKLMDIPRQAALTDEKKELKFGYLAMAFYNAFAPWDDTDRSIVRRTSHWLHASLLYLADATWDEMSELAVRLRNWLMQIVKHVWNGNFHELVSNNEWVRVRQVFIHEDSSHPSAGTNASICGLSDIGGLFDEGALPNLHRRIKKDGSVETNREAYDRICDRDVGRCSTFDTLLDEVKALPATEFAEFRTHESGLSDSFPDPRIRLVMFMAHEYLRYHSWQLFNGAGESDRYDLSHLLYPDEYHVTDKGYHYWSFSKR